MVYVLRDLVESKTMIIAMLFIIAVAYMAGC